MRIKDVDAHEPGAVARFVDEVNGAISTPGGLVMIGTAGLPDQLPKMPGFYMKNITMKAISNASVRMLQDMADAYGVNGLDAIVSGRIPFEEAPEAFRFQRRHDGIGKVIIDHG